MKEGQKNTKYKAVSEALGVNVKKFRKNAGYTQRQLAERLGITRVYMGYIEQGRENPSLKLLFKIANELNTTMDTLIKE
jgi:transcriptional regulator with XRE-family HTH domain